MTEQEMLQHWQGIASQGIQIEHELRIDIERLRAQRDRLLAALRHVADMTHIDTDLEWHFKRGYDPKRVLSVIAAVEEKP